MNYTHKVQGDKLVIEVDISKAAVEAATPSSTGKTNLVAKTGAYVPVRDGIKFMLNVTAPAT